MGQKNVKRSKRRRGHQSRHRKESSYENSSHAQQHRRIAYRGGRHVIKKGGRRWQIKKTESTLPLDLIFAHILPRMSVRQLCQLRCVCKAWDFRLTAGQFLPDKAKELWFLMRGLNFDKQTGVRLLTFSSSEGRGSPFRLPMAGAKLSSYLGGLDWVCLADFPTTHFVVSAGGLICTLVQAVHHGTMYDLIVFNCLTGCVKVLPRPPSQDFFLESHPFFRMHMATDNQDPRRYYVMLFRSWDQWESRDPTECLFEVFDSRSGSWKVGSSPKIKALSGLKVAQGDLFSSLYHASDGTLEVLAYHAAEDAWSAVRVPLSRNDPCLNHFDVPENWYTPRFLRYEGRLFMGRMLVKDYPMGLEVWELQLSSSGTATLAEVARTPETLYQPRLHLDT